MGGILMQGKVTAIENGGYIKILFPSENEAIDLKFEQIIVCSGPWTSQLFPGLKKHLKVKAIPVTYWKDLTENLAYSTSQKFPVIFNARYVHNRLLTHTAKENFIMFDKLGHICLNGNKLN